MIRRPPRSTQSRSSAASDVYKRQARGSAPWLGNPTKDTARAFEGSCHILDLLRNGLPEVVERIWFHLGRAARAPRPRWPSRCRHHRRRQLPGVRGRDRGSPGVRLKPANTGSAAFAGSCGWPTGRSKEGQMADVGWIALAIVGVAGIVWGAEAFAEHLGAAAVALGVSSFALALLLAGAEPEELATGVAASLRHAPAVAFGDVIGANIAMCLVALGIGAVIAPLPFGRRVRLYGLLGLPVGAVCAVLAWSGSVGRLGGLLLVVLYLSLIHISEPTRLGMISYAVFCLK